MKLTTRQDQVARLLVTGATNKAIASALGLSHHTARFHVRAIMLALGCANRTQLAVLLDRELRAVGSEAA